jgi:hypothetical protein
VAAASAACAGIRVWGGDADYDIFDLGHSIAFLTPGTLVIDTDPDEVGAVDFINQIVAPGIQGTVYLYVVKGPGGDPCLPYCPAATYVHVINLTGATGSHIMEVYVADDIADWTLPVKATGIDTHLETSGDIVLGLDVEHLDGYVICDGLGEVQVRGDTRSVHYGRISVRGWNGYAALMHIEGTFIGPIFLLGSLQADGAIEVVGDLWNGLTIGGSMFGTVDVTGNLYQSLVYQDIDNRLHVGGNLSWHFPNVPISLEVDQLITTNGSIEVDGDCIQLWIRYAPVEGTIDVGGSLGTDGFGIVGIAAGGLVHANDLAGVYVPGNVAGTLSATESLSNVELGQVTYSVCAASIDHLTVTGSMDGDISADVINYLSVNGAVTGTIGLVQDAEGLLENCELGSVEAGATVASGTITHFVVTGSVDGTVSATDDLVYSTIGAVGTSGVVVAPYILDLTVAGSVAGQIIATETLDGQLQVGGLPAAGHIQAGTVNGDLGVIGDVYGTILVDNDLPGNIWIVATVPSGSDGSLFGGIVVGGNVKGSINVQGNTEQTGSIYVGGAVNDSGLVDIGRDLLGTITVGTQQQTHNLTGTVHIAGNVSGPGIEIWGNLGSTSHPGQIKIDGSFGNGSALSWIYAHGSMLNAGSFVTVDYDGYHPLHRWAANGRVRIGNAIYSHNTPSMHIFESTLCKGDMNNSGMTLFNDMAPFKLALTDPAGYAAAYPGLAGAMLYHGDLDCDGDIDLDDSNLLASFIGHCTSTCGGGARLTAQTLAQGILVTVPDEDLADVADLVAQTEDSRYDPQDQEYWHEVSAELGQ